MITKRFTMTVTPGLVMEEQAKRVLWKGLRLLPIAMLMAVLATVVFVVPEVRAATMLIIHVDSIADDDPDGGCTLREAITLVNQSSGPGLAPNGCTVSESGAGSPITYEINLPSYTYTLTGEAGEDGNTSGDLDIMPSYGVIINGAGASSTVVDGGGIDRVLHIPVASTVTVGISNLTLRHGQDGGGIRIDGTAVHISNSTVSNNQSNYYGGGIYSNAALTITNSTISENYSKYEAGGIYISGGSLTIDGSVIAGNESRRSGGGIYISGGTLTIDSSVIAGNESRRSGGGIAIKSSTVNISNSTISNNASGSTRDGGGIVSFSSDTTTLNVRDSAVFGNNCGGNGGGISVAKNNKLNVGNSTISGNFADDNGGGIDSAGTTNLTNVSIANNITDDDQSGSGNGGGINHSGGTFSIKNSIVAENTDRSGGGSDCFGTFVSYQFNLIGKNEGCSVSFPAGNPNGNNDHVGTGPFPLDPMIGALTGDPPCHLLQLGSPVMDKIVGSNCSFISSGTNPLFGDGDPVITDQLGTVRDSTCDIGAFEVPLVGIQVLDGNTDIPDDTGSVSFGSTPVGKPVTRTFTVKNTGKTTALTLADLSMPAGFSISSGFTSTTVVTGGQTTFGVQFDASTGPTHTGEVSFTNNVSNRNPFNFTVTGAAVPQIYLPLVLRKR